MIVRELPDGTTLLILQESHADLAQQFAAHWGNQEFSRLDPYASMVFGTGYHDSGHREMEADLPIDPETGVPYFHRNTPLALRKRDADANNFQWIRGRDTYASLMVSMHHAGLRKRRYGTVLWGQGVRDGYEGGSREGASQSGSLGELGMAAAFADLKEWQLEVADHLRLDDPVDRDRFWHNYRCLQTFDQLSLYFCCDGYDGEPMKEVTLERVPVAYGSERTVDLRLSPIGPNTIRMTPYPFDVPRFSIGIMTRQMVPCIGEPDDTAKEGYYSAVRRPLTWDVTSS
jgi:hypothetical protein